MFVNATKSTSDVSKEVFFCLGEEEVLQLYTAPRKKRRGGLGWPQERFDQVAWWALYKCLVYKPDRYGIWLLKQSSGVCATRYNMARLQDHLDNWCSNCWQVDKASYLNACPSEAQTS